MRFKTQFFINPKSGRHTKTHVVDTQEGFTLCGRYPSLTDKAVTVSDSPEAETTECGVCQRKCRLLYSNPHDLIASGTQHQTT